MWALLTSLLPLERWPSYQSRWRWTGNNLVWSSPPPVYLKHQHTRFISLIRIHNKGSYMLTTCYNALYLQVYCSVSVTRLLPYFPINVLGILNRLSGFLFYMQGELENTDVCVLLSCQYLRRGKAVVPVVCVLSDTPYGGTLWLRYNRELTANTTTPPRNNGNKFTIWVMILSRNWSYKSLHM